MASFLEIDRRYSNASALCLNEYRISSHAVATVVEITRELLRQLDRQDSSQRELASMVWRLRSSIFFTLLPFSADALGIAELARSISSAVSRLPFVQSLCHRFGPAITALLDEGSNPKWIAIEALVGSSPEDHRHGIFTAMAFGRSFGRPPSGNAGKSANAIWVESSSAMRTISIDRLTVIGMCRYLSRQAYADIFHSGCAADITILLYPGETFEWKVPPTLCRNRSSGAPYNREPAIRAIETTARSEVKVDERDDVDVWREAHSGNRSPALGLTKSRFVLFKDGRGLFVPEDSAVLLLVDRAVDARSDLVESPARDAREGDAMVVRAEAGGYLVGLGDQEEEFDREVESASDWRPALEAMLMRTEVADIATEMRRFGAKNVSLAGSIRHWADGSTYGPGTLGEFRALITVLERAGTLRLQESADLYIADRWQRLSALRAGRQRLGQSIRHHVLNELRAHFAKFGRTDEISVIPTEYGQEFHVCFIAAVDDSPSWVPNARLMTLQSILR